MTYTPCMVSILHNSGLKNILRLRRKNLAQIVVLKYGFKMKMFCSQGLEMLLNSSFFSMRLTIQNFSTTRTLILIQGGPAEVLLTSSGRKTERRHLILIKLRSATIFLKIHYLKSKMLTKFINIFANTFFIMPFCCTHNFKKFVL